MKKTAKKSKAKARKPAGKKKGGSKKGKKKKKGSGSSYEVCITGSGTTGHCDWITKGGKHICICK
jgi:hypothetical protein